MPFPAGFCLGVQVCMCMCVCACMYEHALWPAHVRTLTPAPVACTGTGLSRVYLPSVQNVEKANLGAESGPIVETLSGALHDMWAKQMLDAGGCLCAVWVCVSSVCQVCVCVLCLQWVWLFVCGCVLYLQVPHKCMSAHPHFLVHFKTGRARTHTQQPLIFHMLTHSETRPNHRSGWRWAQMKNEAAKEHNLLLPFMFLTGVAKCVPM
jgi:hypothetical protein